MRFSIPRRALLLAVAVAMAASAQAQAPVVLDAPLWTVAPGDVDWLANDNLTRGAGFNPVTSQMLIATRNGGPRLFALNAATGAVAGTFNTTGVTGGTFAINVADASDDGQVFAANMVVSADAGGSPFRIYRWSDPDTAPTMVYSGAPVGLSRFGDSFTVVGAGANVRLYASGSATASVAEFLWDGTTLTGPRMIPVAAGSARGGIAAGPTPATLWINGAGTTVREIDTQTGATVREIPGTVSTSAYSAVAFFRLEGRSFVVSGIKNPEFEADILDVTTPGSERVVARVARFGTNPNANAAGNVVYDAAANRLLMLGTNNGITAHALEALRPPVLSERAWAIEAGSVTWFGNDNNTRGGAYNPATDHFIAVSRSGGLNMRLLDAATGAERGMMNTTGIAGGTFVLSEIAVTADGQIFGANLTVSPATSPVRIYRWRHERAQPELVFSGALPGPRYGDALGVFGSGNAVSVYVSGAGNDRIARLNWTGTALAEAASLQPEAGVPRGRFGLAPVSDTELWVNSPTHPLALINAQTGAILREVLESPRTTAGASLVAFERDGRRYLATGPQFGFEEGFAVVDVTTPGAEAVTARTPVLGTNGNGNASGSAGYDLRRDNLIVLGTNNLIASYSLGAAPANPAPVASLITAPPDAATLTVEGPQSQTATIAWTAAQAAGAPAFTYTWELTTAPGAAPLVSQSTTETMLTFTFAQLDAVLAGAGVQPGQSVTLLHRANAAAGDLTLTGQYSSVTFTRGIVVSSASDAAPAAFRVHGVAPNPSAAGTSLRLDLPEATEVEVRVFDALGREVLRVPPTALAAGAGAVALPTARLAPGTYVWHLTATAGADAITRTGRLTVVR